MMFHRLIKALRDVCHVSFAALREKTDETFISLPAVEEVDQFDTVVRVWIPG
jgi:hypothetical protein